MRARSNSNTAGHVAKADPDSVEYRDRVAVPVMQAVDAMPVAYRALVDELGYVDVYRAWRRGLSVAAIRERARDGVMVL
jgi:hypothetical protein